MLYVARAVIDSEGAGSGIFDGFVALARDVIGRLAAEDELTGDIDLVWAPLYPVILNLGTVLFEPVISRHLPKSFYEPESLERWNRATTNLFRAGLLKSG